MIENITIRPSMVSPTTELYIGENFLEEELLRGICLQLQGRVVVVTSEILRDLYGAKLAKKLGAELLIIPSGKNEKTQKHLENELFRMGCGRDTILIALGGGSITDLVGFVASIYLRGVFLILVPTTLLAMVDAAIGGKTSIDTMFGKNQIGTFYYPKAIIADVNVLKTLPEKEWANGLIEVLKMGLVFDKSIWDIAKKSSKSRELISKAVQGKITITERDPTEQGLRRILNFGHTIGHALEQVAEYTISHGEAVAIGSLAEAHLSMQLGYLPRGEFEEIQSLYSSFSLQLPKLYTRRSFFKAVAYDKKKLSDKVRFVLIDKIGHALPFEGAYCRPVIEEELKPTLDWMEKNYGGCSHRALAASRELDCTSL